MEKKQSKLRVIDQANTTGIVEVSLPADKTGQQETFTLAAAKRTNRMDNTRHWSLILFVWFSLFILMALIVGRLWHVMTPRDIRWLSKDDLARIDEIFVDGSIGALLVGFFQEFILGKK